MIFKITYDTYSLTDLQKAIDKFLKEHPELSDYPIEIVGQGSGCGVEIHKGINEVIVEFD